jgi:hypothetical protein
MVGSYDSDEYALKMKYYHESGYNMNFSMTFFDKLTKLNDMTDKELKYNYENLDKSYYNRDAKRAWKEIIEDCILNRRVEKISKIKNKINGKRTE